MQRKAIEEPRCLFKMGHKGFRVVPNGCGSVRRDEETGHEVVNDDYQISHLSLIPPHEVEVPCEHCGEYTSFAAAGRCDWCCHLEGGLRHLVCRVGKERALEIVFGLINKE